MKAPKLVLTSAVTEGDETTFRSWALCTVQETHEGGNAFDDQ